MSIFSDKKAIIDHYDTEVGLGNLYKLNADWLTGIKTILFGWENVPEHPGGVHYGYDFNGKNANESLKKAYYEAFDHLDIVEGKILDCGCGVGAGLYLLAPLHPKIFFTGVSIAPGQIKTATKRANKAGLKNVKYITEDYLDIPFNSESFDGIIGIETFCHVDDKLKPKLFSELYRVLRNGGRVAVFDAFLSDKKPDKMFMLSKHKKIFRGWNLPDKISTNRFFSNQAASNGFKIIKKNNITRRILDWSKEVKKRVIFAKPLVPIVKKFIAWKKSGISLPLISQIGFDNKNILDFVYTAEYQYDMFKSGDVEYWEVVIEKV